MKKSNLPPGTRVVNVRGLIPGDVSIDSEGKQFTYMGYGHEGANYPILAPDNAYCKFLDQVVIPQGYELIGTIAESYRYPDSTDWMVSAAASMEVVRGFYGALRLCVRPVKKTKRVAIIEVDVPACVDKELLSVQVLLSTLSVQSFSALRISRVEERDA